MKFTVRQLNMLKIYCLKRKFRKEAGFLQEVIDKCLKNKLNDYDFQGNEGLSKMVKQLEEDEKHTTDRQRTICVKR